jgi:MoxR-like ATPase
MKKIEIHTRYYFLRRYPEKYKLADLKPLISFGASPRGINLANAKCYAFIKRRGM